MLHAQNVAFDGHEVSVALELVDTLAAKDDDNSTLTTAH